MKHQLTDELLEQLATLSKLDLETTERTSLYQGLKEILTYVEKINDLNTDNIPPLTHFPECTKRIDGSTDSPLRKDYVFRETHPEQLLALAPRQSASYYIVPNTFNGE